MLLTPVGLESGLRWSYRDGKMQQLPDNTAAANITPQYNHNLTYMKHRKVITSTDVHNTMLGTPNKAMVT